MLRVKNKLKKKRNGLPQVVKINFIVSEFPEGIFLAIKFD